MRGIIILGLITVISIPVVIHGRTTQTMELHARMAEMGGWTPENLNAVVGVPLRLRLTSDDVTHGFAVGYLDQPAVEVKPGEMTNITLVFTHLGKYTFYCSRWCGVNHWRMRGTIEVTDLITTPAPAKSPLYVALGLNIDAAHQASVTPGKMPSAWRGALLNRMIPTTYTSKDYYLSHTPLDMWLTLRANASYADLSDQEVWDLVAWVWQSDTTLNRCSQASSYLPPIALLAMAKVGQVMASMLTSWLLALNHPMKTRPLVSIPSVRRILPTP